MVMLIRNLNIKKWLCNGTRLQITKLGRNLIHAKILTGKEEGQVIAIPRIKLTPK
jgi:ATP-dependent DNA helicase PIF1